MKNSSAQFFDKEGQCTWIDIFTKNVNVLNSSVKLICISSPPVALVVPQWFGTTKPGHPKRVLHWHSILRKQLLSTTKKSLFLRNRETKTPPTGEFPQWTSSIFHPSCRNTNCTYKIAPLRRRNTKKKPVSPCQHPFCPSSQGDFSRPRVWAWIQPIGWRLPAAADCFLLFQSVGASSHTGVSVFSGQHTEYTPCPPRASFGRQWGNACVGCLCIK